MSAGTPTPRKPATIDPLADRVLNELSRAPESAEIVVGGYFALQHYVEYRKTHDIDAWWRTRASVSVEGVIRDVMRRVAADEGSEMRERHFGDTLSFDLVRADRKYFSFQIAVRSVELEPPGVSAWPPIRIETLNDNIGAKMNALVDRGSPRDFADIQHVVGRALATVEECWMLWARKNPGGSVEEAKKRGMHHLAALERRRPLECIESLPERNRADETRKWLRHELLKLR